MPTFKFTSPEGKTHVVTGPEGATAEEAFSMLQQQLGGPAPEANAPDMAMPPPLAPSAPDVPVAAAPQPGLFSAQRLGLEGLGKAPAMIARGIGTGLTGTVGMVGDALNAGINMAGQAIGHNPQLGKVSDAIQGTMTAAGLPEPKSTKERILSTLVSMAAGGKDPVMTGLTKRFLPPTATPQLNGRENAILEGQRAGYVVPPSEATGGAVGTTLEALSDKTSLWNAMAQKNQTVTDKLARRVAGLAEDAPLTDETLNAAKQATYQQGYDPIRNLGPISTGGVYRRALDKVLNDFQGAPRSFPGAARDDVRQLVDAYRVRQFNANDAVDAISSLRQDATTAFRNGNPNLGNAQTGIARALENNIELNVSNPELLSNFRAARRTLAQQNVISKALERGTGEVNAQKIAGQLKRSGENYLTGDLATIGRFASNAQKVTRVPTQQSVPMIRHPLPNALTTIAAGFMGGPVPAAAVGAAPFGQAGLRHLIMSGAGQRMLAPTVDPGLLAKLMGNPEFVNAMPNLLQQSGLFGQ